MSSRRVGLHQRQFVVGPVPRPLATDWASHRIGPHLWLSCCPRLRRVHVLDADGTAWVLLGLAVQTDADRLDPSLDLAACATDEIPRRYESWAGRWVLVGDGCMHLDAGGLLGCHWTVTATGDVWASSSPAALVGLDGVGRPRAYELRHERGLSWVVPPLGRRTGVRRLLPSQVLDLTDGRLLRRRLVTPADELPGDPKRALGLALTEAVRRLPAGVPKQVALSAGNDSRVVLAAALAGGAEVEVFTRRAARMSISDRLVPPRLAARVGLPHVTHAHKRSDPRRQAAADAHTDRHVSIGDATPFVQSARDGLTGVELGGQGFGVGKVTSRDLPAQLPVDDREAADLIADCRGEPPDSANRESLAEWIAWIRADAPDSERSHSENSELDWRDRFYIEQRMAGWQASKEQLYDLDGHERFCPVNAARTYGLLLAIDPAQRRGGAHQHDLVEQLDRRLLAEPINAPNHEHRLVDRLAHLLIVDPRGASARIGRALRSRAGRAGSKTRHDLAHLVAGRRRGRQHQQG